MTRKHFKLFAEAIGRIENAKERQNTVEIVAKVCKSDNPNFDLARFMAAINAVHKESTL